MATASTGEIRWVAGKPQTRVPIGVGRHRVTVHLTAAKSKPEAKERAALVVEQARCLRSSRIGTQAVEALLNELGGACTPKEIAEALQAIAWAANGDAKHIPQTSRGSAPTFAEVVEEWTSGELARRFPHQIHQAGDGHLKNVKGRVAKSCFDGIRNKPVDQIPRQDCDTVMSRLPLPPGKTEIGEGTRRQYGTVITRTFSLAELAGYIERSPLPKGWLPKSGPRKRFPILYPSEDRVLLGCVDLPIEWRLYWGYLHREGHRRGEGADLQFYELDLHHGTVALDENKTENARWWPLSPGVAEALRWWRDKRGAGPRDLVFIDESGGPLNLDHMADRVRAHLRSAGLDREDLFSKGKNKRHFGTHCFRRSMATRNLALGRPEDWVRQRTGHTTDELYRYRMQARSLEELALGDVDPLVLCLPETSPLEGIGGALGELSERRPPARLPQDCPREGLKVVGAARFERATPRPPGSSESAENSINPAVSRVTSHEIERDRTPVGQPWGNASAPWDAALAAALHAAADDAAAPLLEAQGSTEAALAEALARASAAGQWSIVGELARALESRRRERLGVTDLSVERAKRGGRP